MGRIFKYEMRRRFNTILVLVGVIAVLSIGSIILLGFSKSSFDRMGSSGAVWAALTFFALVFIPIVMFFTCSNGHIDELLYKDTNYLMLTIPIRSQAILGGRILAGFVEYLIYLLVSAVFFIIIIVQQVVLYSSNFTRGFFSVIGDILHNVFILNFLPLLYVVLLTVSSFLLIGTVFMFVKALTRSFIRKKILAQFIAIVLFILLFERMISLGSYLSHQWDLIQYIDLNLISYTGHNFMSSQLQPIPVHLVTSIMILLISVVFFIATSWLFDKKVEL